MLAERLVRFSPLRGARFHRYPYTLFDLPVAVPAGAGTGPIADGTGPSAAPPGDQEMTTTAIDMTL
ncbi:MAG TPA: hypothetical protein VHA10_25500 [Hypericibacter adhaerens]|jgi:hypothetical protein|nr:hypothetical protein [Hypericibacter adhaerens]